MYRRQFLKASAAAAGTMMMPVFSAGHTQAAASPRSLVVATRTLDVNGKAATVYGLTDGAGRPGLTFQPGESFLVTMENRLAEPTIVHWHGLIPPFDQDGVGNNPLPLLEGGKRRDFDFTLDRPGTYWMHAHTLQHQNLLSAPLIVHSAEDAKADMQEVVVMLHDFSFTPADELLANLRGGISGHGMDHGTMDHGSMDMGEMGMGAMDMESMSMGAMDLNDISYDAYLANDRTLGDPEVVHVEKGGRVRLRIINGAASTAFSISTGALTATLVAVDGQPVEPLTANIFGMTMGQRIDLEIAIPAEGGAFPILALREGAPERTGIVLATSGAVVAKIPTTADVSGPVLDIALEASLVGRTQLPARPADREFMVHLTGTMKGYQWGMGGAGKLAARPGERIEISLMNMSMMAHPMHLHGHHFQVVAVDGKRFAGAMRDTVLVPPMKTVTIAFDAGQAGNWPFHCHHLYHMESGMMANMKVA